MHFELESDRNVLVDGIGLLEPNVPVVVTDEMRELFKHFNHQELVGAQFPHFVKLTAVVD